MGQTGFTFMQGQIYGSEKAMSFFLQSKDPASWESGGHDLTERDKIQNADITHLSKGDAPGSLIYRQI